MIFIEIYKKNRMFLTESETFKLYFQLQFFIDPMHVMLKIGVHSWYIWSCTTYFLFIKIENI